MNAGMRLTLAVLVGMAHGLAGCGPTPVRDLSAHYREHQDYRSLRELVKCLNLGMSEKQVTAILGQPDYSPTDGIYYYSSDREVEYEGGTTCVGVIVEYHVSTGGKAAPIRTLEGWNFGPVYE